MKHLTKCILTLSIITGLWSQDKKIFISADLEGVVGAVTGEQLGPGGFEYNRFREFMTAEVNAAIEAAKSAGATEILVAVGELTTAIFFSLAVLRSILSRPTPSLPTALQLTIESRSLPFTWVSRRTIIASASWATASSLF